MEITTGTLGIQCPELLAYGVNSFSTVSTIYQSLAESEDGKNLTKDLMDNPRILELLNEKISYVSKSGVRLFPYCLLTYIMPPLYKR